MSLLTANSAAAKMTAAMKSEDEQAITEAWEAFQEETADSIRADFKLFQKTQDESVLAQRGYRVLTSAEQAWYKNVAQALKDARSNQAFIDILKSADKDDIMPETIIDDVLRYLVETRPCSPKSDSKTPASPRSGSSTTTPCNAAAGAKSTRR